MDTNWSKSAVAQFQAILRAPVRNINTAVNKYAVMFPTQDQKSVFRFGDGVDISAMEGEAPSWCYAEFLLVAQDSNDTRVGCPDDFVLMAILASSTVNTVGGFRLQIYDANRKMQIIKDRPVNAGAYAGNGTSPLFLRVPYPLVKRNAQLLVRVTNLETATNDVQVVFFGYQGGVGS